MPTYGRIYFAIGDGPETYVTIQHCPTEAGLLHLANALAGLTVARITRCEFISFTWCGHAESAGDYADTRMKGIIKFRDAEEERKLWAIPLPAPRQDLFEEVSGKMMLKNSIGELVTQAYSTASQQPFTYEHGWLVGNTY